MTKTPPSIRRQLQYSNAAADAHHNAQRMRNACGDRSEWPVRKILRTWIFQKQK